MQGDRDLCLKLLHRCALQTFDRPGHSGLFSEAFPEILQGTFFTMGACVLSIVHQLGVASAARGREPHRVAAQDGERFESGLDISP